MAEENENLKHSVNIQGMISQLGSDHDLLEELLTNAIEAGESVINVTLNEAEGILIIENDGNALTLDQIRSKLLRSFETGDEKVEAESNRGLGFVSIYGAMEKTVVDTGKYHITINDWDNIETDKRTTSYDGLSVKVYLHEKAKALYTGEFIQKALNKWVLANGIKVYFQGKEACKYISDDFNSSPLAAGIDYVPEVELLAGKGSIVLLKLTNVDAYRILPIRVPINYAKTRTLKTISFIVSRGEHLTTDRKAFQFNTSWMIEKHITRLDSILAKEEASDETGAVIRKFLNHIQETINIISEELKIKKKLLYPIIKNTKDALHVKDLDTIVKHVTFFNQFTGMLKTAKSCQVFTSDFVNSGSKYVDQKIVISHVSKYEFRSWFNKIFEFPPEDLFLNERVGLLVNYGNISGEAVLRDLLRMKRWVEMDTDLFGGNALENESIVIVFNNEAEFYADISGWEIPAEDLISKDDVSISIDAEDALKLGDEVLGEGAENAAAQEIIKQSLKSGDMHPMDLEMVESKADQKPFSSKTEEGRVVKIDDPELFKMLTDYGSDEMTGEYRFKGDESVTEEQLKESPAMFHISNDEESGKDLDEYDAEDMKEVLEKIKEVAPQEEILSKHVMDDEEYENTVIDLKAENAELRIWDIDEVSVPVLVYSTARADFNACLRSGGKVREKKVLKSYQQWSQVIELIVKYYPEIENKPAPVIVMNGDKDISGEHVGRFIGINYFALPNLSDMRLKKILKILHVAIHEVVHVFVAKHADPRFTSLYNSIYDRLTAEIDFLKELKAVF